MTRPDGASCARRVGLARASGPSARPRPRRHGRDHKGGSVPDGAIRCAASRRRGGHRLPTAVRAREAGRGGLQQHLGGHQREDLDETGVMCRPGDRGVDAEAALAALVILVRPGPERLAARPDHLCLPTSAAAGGRNLEGHAQVHEGAVTAGETPHRQGAALRRTGGTARSAEAAAVAQFQRHLRRRDRHAAARQLPPSCIGVRGFVPCASRFSAGGARGAATLWEDRFCLARIIGSPPRDRIPEPDHEDPPCPEPPAASPSWDRPVWLSMPERAVPVLPPHGRAGEPSVPCRAVPCRAVPCRVRRPGGRDALREMQGADMSAAGGGRRAPP